MTDVPRYRVRPLRQPEPDLSDESASPEPVEYKVGYARPPVETRFKPGNCANPKGRPKGKKDAATVLREKLDAKVTVTEGGRKKKMSKLEIGATKLVNRFAEAGDRKDFIAIYQALGGRSGLGQGALEAPLANSNAEGPRPIEECRAILDWYVSARIAQANSEEVGSEPPEGAAS